MYRKEKKKKEEEISFRMDKRKKFCDAAFFPCYCVLQMILF